MTASATRESLYEEILRSLDGKIIDRTEKSVKRIVLDISPDDVLFMANLFFKQLNARLQIATGLDSPDAIVIMYHWAFDQYNLQVTVRTKVDRNKPEIESIANIFKGAEWIEREIWELLGVTFKNHPDMRHLLLLDNWPEGKFPLRRDYKK